MRWGAGSSSSHLTVQLLGPLLHCSPRISDISSFHILRRHFSFGFCSSITSKFSRCSLSLFPIFSLISKHQFMFLPEVI